MADGAPIELNQQIARTLARLQAGEEVIVTDRGKSIARIAPVELGRRAGRAAGTALCGKGPSAAFP